tara:strand:- start:135 stop:635 length:501 start_codon:yes stop_codon:yes gene_type:complete
MFNKLTRQSTYAANQLFATLDTKTRKLNNSYDKTVLLSDTVGFIRDLPHTLIAAFRATLEEVVSSDLLIHVVDSGCDDKQLQMDSVNKVLFEIGAQTVPQLVVFNKTDLTRLDIGIKRHPCAKIENVRVSAKNGLGLDDLRQCINELLFNAAPDQLELQSPRLTYS